MHDPSLLEASEDLNIPSAPAQEISPHLTLQPPLSRRGSGPGLILVVDHYSELNISEKSLDPPPLQKWAEEGFAVVQLKVPGQKGDGGEFPLERAIETLRDCEHCIWGDGIGLICMCNSVIFHSYDLLSIQKLNNTDLHQRKYNTTNHKLAYLTRIPFYVEEAAYFSPHIKALISYGGRQFTSLTSPVNSNATMPPQLVHSSGPQQPRRESFSIVPDTNTSPTVPPESSVKIFHYVKVEPDTKWVLPAEPDYHSTYAGIAHTRSLAFLKPLLNGPYFDLEAIWDEHCRYEFGERDVARTMATMVAQPYVNHIPTLTGGIGQEKLSYFYANHFVHANPEDTELELVSRTVGTDRVVDEFVFKLTHNRQVDWLLPGIPPTGKYLEIPFTSIVGMRGDRLCHEHIHWDQGTAMRQLGLLPEWLKFPYPIDGKDAGEGKRYEVRAPTTGVETARKLVDEGSLDSNELMKAKWREVDDA